MPLAFFFLYDKKYLACYLRWYLIHTWVSHSSRRLFFFIFFYLEQVDSTWIVYNKPRNSQLTEEHAGFLMALGLSGHLNSLSYMNLHDYLCKVRLQGRAFARVTFKNFTRAFFYRHRLYHVFVITIVVLSNTSNYLRHCYHYRHRN